MSQSQSASAPSGPLGTVLASLEAEHASVPPVQRGLAPELKALSDRLKADPTLENDPRFSVEIAWLVQDWAQHSGTGKPAPLPPLLHAGLQAMAQQLPGLENPDMKALLARAPTIVDRLVVQDIRAQALHLAAMSAPDQTSVAATKAIAVLEYRADQTQADAPGATVQPAPKTAQTAQSARTSAPSASEPSQAAAPMTQQTAAPVPAPAAAQPATGQRSSPSAAGGEAQTNPPATAPSSAQASAGQAQQGTASPTAREAAQDAPPAPSPTSPTAAGAQAEPAGPSAFKPPPARPNPGAQAVADVVAQVVGGTLAPVAGVVQGIGKGLSTHMANHRAQSDRRAIDNHVEKLRIATRYAEADLGSLREHGRPFFERFDKAVAQAGGDAQQVIADMAPGRPHEALHQALKDTLAQNPGFSEAWNRLRSSTDALGRQSELLRFEAAQRGMSDDQSVQEGEQAAAKTGWKLANLPGLEAGKTFLREASQMVEALVERFRDFLSRVFGRNEQRDQSPSPSPGQ